MKINNTIILLLLTLQIPSFAFSMQNNSPNCMIHYRIDGNSTSEQNDCSILKLDEGNFDINNPDPIDISIAKAYLKKNQQICLTLTTKNTDQTICDAETSEHLLVINTSNQCNVWLNKNNKIVLSKGCTTHSNKAIQQAAPQLPANQSITTPTTATPPSKAKSPKKSNEQKP